MNLSGTYVPLGVAGTGSAVINNPQTLINLGLSVDDRKYKRKLAEQKAKADKDKTIQDHWDKVKAIPAEKGGIAQEWMNKEVKDRVDKVVQLKRSGSTDYAAADLYTSEADMINKYGMSFADTYDKNIKLLEESKSYNVKDVDAYVKAQLYDENGQMKDLRGVKIAEIFSEATKNADFINQQEAFNQVASKMESPEIAYNVPVGGGYMQEIKGKIYGGYTDKQGRLVMDGTHPARRLTLQDLRTFDGNEAIRTILDRDTEKLMKASEEAGQPLDYGTARFTAFNEFMKGKVMPKDSYSNRLEADQVQLTRMKMAQDDFQFRTKQAGEAATKVNTVVGFQDAGTIPILTSAKPGSKWSYNLKTTGSIGLVNKDGKSLPVRPLPGGQGLIVGNTKDGKSEFEYVSVSGQTGMLQAVRGGFIWNGPADMPIDVNYESTGVSGKKYARKGQINFQPGQPITESSVRKIDFAKYGQYMTPAILGEYALLDKTGKASYELDDLIRKEEAKKEGADTDLLAKYRARRDALNNQPAGGEAKDLSDPTNRGNLKRAVVNLSLDAGNLAFTRTEVNNFIKTNGSFQTPDGVVISNFDQWAGYVNDKGGKMLSGSTGQAQAAKKPTNLYTGAVNKAKKFVDDVKNFRKKKPFQGGAGPIPN
jgi:hypothetical protein